MSSDELDYYEQRAEAEIELARRAENSDVVRAHYQLACAYLDRIYPAAEEAVQRQTV